VKPFEIAIAISWHWLTASSKTPAVARLEPMSGKLKVGLMVAASGTIEGWEAYILSQLQDDPEFEWVVILQHREPGGRGTGFVDKLKSKWRRIPHVAAQRVMERFDRFLGRSHYNSVGDFGVDARYPVSRFLPDVPVLPVEPAESASGLVQRFDAGTIEKIRDFQPDLLIRLGFKILKGEILTVAPFGIVSYHHADNTSNRGGPCGFWEVYHDLEQTGATLQVLTEELDGGMVVKRVLYPTYRFSWDANKRRLRATSTWLMIDALRELARTRKWTFVPDVRPLRIYAHPLLLAPKLSQSIAFAGKLLGRILSHVASRVFAIRQWRILYRIAEPSTSAGPVPADLSLRKLRQLVPARNRFLADPFLFVHDSKLYLFVEDYSRSTGRACISWFEWSGKDWKEGGVALECAYHLSYPFIFVHQSRVFMIPESLGSRRIELWEADPFPSRWKLTRVLMDNVSAVDSTILARDGKLYLFTNLDRANVGDPGTELYIFWTDDLLNGSWHPHARNPVIQDCRVARNAGGFFEDREGRLIRAAQINGSEYGQGLVFRLVKRLTGSEYEEETLEQVLPLWESDIVGMHHFQAAGANVVMDSCHRVSRF